jgi:hypothetical protein
LFSASHVCKTPTHPSMRSVKILEGEARMRETPLPTQKIIHDVGRGFRIQGRRGREGRELWSRSGRGEEKGMLCERRFCDGLELYVVCVYVCHAVYRRSVTEQGRKSHELGKNRKTSRQHKPWWRVPQPAAQDTMS